MSTPSAYKFFQQRELLERQSYTGPVQHEGGGVTNSYDWTGLVVEASVWTPKPGNRFVISLITINTTAKCTVTLYEEVDSKANRIYKGEIAANGNVVIPYVMPRPSTEDNRTLYIKTSAGSGYVTVWGWESGSGTTTTSTSTSSSSISSSSSSVSTSSISSSSSSVSTSSISSSSSSISSSSSSSSSSISTSSSSISSSSSSISVSSSTSSITQTVT